MVQKTKCGQFVSFNVMLNLFQLLKTQQMKQRNIFEKCKMTRSIIVIRSLQHVSSNNSKSTDHISLIRTDHCYSKVSKVFQFATHFF